MSKSPYRRHFLIPDTQTRKGVPLDHIPWIAQAIVDYAPDVVVHIGDHWDNPAFSQHDQKGSVKMEGARYEDDIAVGNEAFSRLGAPMFREIKRQERNKKRWNPERHFAFGNHETRLQRAIDADPKLIGCIGMHHMLTNGWVRHNFLNRFRIDGISYSHYFQAQNSSFAIAGTIDNRLNKIGESFVQGHQQGFLYGNRVYPTGVMRHGLVAGSAYLHKEDYKGAQGNTHFRGVVILNEVKDGNYCVMPLTLGYLCRRYEKMDLVPYLKKRYSRDKVYKHENWSYLNI